MISELRARGPAGGNDEFVELFNGSGSDADTSGYRLQGCSSTDFIGTRAIVPSGTMLAPGQHFLFTNGAAGGYSGVVPGDASYTTGIADNGGRLTDVSGTNVDQAGAANSNPCKEGTGLAFPTQNGDNSFEREDSSRQDTDDNAADFASPKAGDP